MLAKLTWKIGLQPQTIVGEAATLHSIRHILLAIAGHVSKCQDKNCPLWLDFHWSLSDISDVEIFDF